MTDAPGYPPGLGNLGPKGFTMASDIILETHDLKKEFRGFLAVNNVSLRVRRHSIHALIGPNGAGKTTCFNLITRYLHQSAGRIWFDGHNISHATPADLARRGMGRSFQISAVYPHLTVQENVRLAVQSRHGSTFCFCGLSALSTVLTGKPCP